MNSTVVVSENALLGTLLQTFSLFDRDNATQTYSFSSNRSNLVGAAIVASTMTGQLTVSGSINFEVTGPLVVLTVTVSLMAVRGATV